MIISDAFKCMTYCTIVWDLGWVAEQAHASWLIVPQHGGVVQKALLGDGLSISAKFDITKAIICNGSMQW